MPARTEYKIICPPSEHDGRIFETAADAEAAGCADCKVVYRDIVTITTTGSWEEWPSDY